MSRRIKAIVNGTREFEGEIGPEGLKWDGSWHPIKKVAGKKDSWLVQQGTRNYRVQVQSLNHNAKEAMVLVNGRAIQVKLEDEYDRLLHQLGMDKAAGARGGDLRAPMPGLVLKVLVEPGVVFESGNPLLILEAMKMENVLKATQAGKVKEVKVQAGTKVEKNQVLLVLE